MKISNNDLIADLKKRTNENIVIAGELSNMEEVALQQKENEKAWSALECVEHLNRYSDFYLNRMSEQIDKGIAISNGKLFQGGVLGNYFTKIMGPKEKLNKMKTVPSMNPKGRRLSSNGLSKFIKDQKHLLELLDKAKTIDLKKGKIPVSFARIIKVRLGDAFRFVIAHNQRHLEQAQRAVNKNK